MSSPTLIALAAVAGLLVTAGCQAPASVAVVEQGLRCPTPNYCNTTNGTGVYFQEGGSAGIGKYQLLITRFINWRSTVLFDGRFYDSNPADGAAPGWQTFGQDALPYGSIYTASYKGSWYTVEGVGTYGTLPVWTLVGASTVNVYGADLVNLILYIRFVDPDVRQLPDGRGGYLPNYDYYTLTFSSSSTESGVSANPYARTTLFKYNLQWHEGYATDTASANQYCYGALTRAPYPFPPYYPADSVVFQGGIDVDAVNGGATLAPSDVTMSCRYGAPATAYWWGHDPLSADEGTGASMFRFGAAIQMKRASYCGNGEVHTIAGTKINVLDDVPIESQPVTDATLEAFWSPTGALCWSGLARRADAPPFSGSCTNSAGQTYQLGACPTIAHAEYESQFGTPFLADGIISGQ